jgi:hypothetical protein
VYRSSDILLAHQDLDIDNCYYSHYVVKLCTSCRISEILGAQRAQNAGQGNLTDAQKVVRSIIFCGTMVRVSDLWGVCWPIVFSRENDQCSLHDRRRSVVHSGILSGLVSDVSGRYVPKIVHGHALVQTDQVNCCACTHTQNGFANRPKQTACTLIHWHRWEAIHPRNFFYCCTMSQIPLHTAQKNWSHVHNSAA